MSDYGLLACSSRKKCQAAIALVQASVNKLSSYDAAKIYTPDELEPYDALADRYIRAVEVSIKFFRSYELYQQAVAPDTFRDLLHRMEKYGLIHSTVLWVEMRDVRNRIVHDYIPEKIEHMFDLLLGEYGRELIRLGEKLKRIQL